MCRVIIFLQPALLVLGGGGGGVVVVEVEGTEEKGKGVQEALWQGERRMHVVTVNFGCIRKQKPEKFESKV
jgi:hypothetical protein